MVLCLAVMIFSLTACDNFAFTAVDGANADADTISNGGSVVKQGDKLYFVNGKTDEKAPNKFGKVEKGAIVRVSVNEDGSLKDDYKVIVPKNVYSKGGENGKSCGFYIFNDKIYYLTPCDGFDKDDKPLYNTLDVMCANIDGTGTKKLGFVDALEFEYKFTASSFVYFKNNTIFIHNFEDFENPIKIENVTAMLLPKTENYNKDTNYVTDYIFYTRALTTEESDKGHRNNVLCAVKCDGSNQIEIVNHNTKVDNKTDTNDSTITLKKYKVFGDSITLYYTRKDADNLLTEKFCSYTFTLDSLAAAEGKTYFSKDSEKLIYTGAIADFIPYTSDSVLEIKEQKIVLYKDNSFSLVENTYNKETLKGIFPGTFVALREEAEGTMMYYSMSNGVYKFVFAKNNVIAVEAPTLVFEGTLANNVFGNEFIGDYFYFADATNQNYIGRINVTKSNTKDDVQFVGVRSTEDEIAIQAQKRNEKK